MIPSLCCSGLSGLPGGDDLESYNHLSRFSSRRDPACRVEGLECTRMDNDHWKVPPYWTREYMLHEHVMKQFRSRFISDFSFHTYSKLSLFITF